MCRAHTVSVSPVTDASFQFGDRQHQANVVSRRWAPTSDIDSVSFVESLSDSDVDERWWVVLLLSYPLVWKIGKWQVFDSFQGKRQESVRQSGSVSSCCY